MEKTTPTGSLRLGRRPLGRTGLEVSPLALAGMSMSGSTSGEPPLAPEDVERAFHEHGVNTFLVTPRMGAIAEGVRRLIRAGHRDELVLMTLPSIPVGWAVRHSWTRIARALQTDRLDVFLLGWVQARWYVTGRTWPAMQRLKDEGKVRAIGFSCHKRRMATELARELGIDVLMIRYNAAHRGAEREVFDPLGAERPGIVAYTVTRWGTLLRPLPEAGFAQGMTGPECYRFALSHPAVDLALCGARSAGELRADVAGVLAGPLDEPRAAEVRAFGDAVHAAGRGAAAYTFR